MRSTDTHKVVMKSAFLIIDADRFHCLVNTLNNIRLLPLSWLYPDVRKKIDSCTFCSILKPKVLNEDLSLLKIGLNRGLFPRNIKKTEKSARSWPD